jgi:Zn-dependent peptidase ImmA (M78 family)
MSAPAIDAVARQRETKVCPSSEPALDVGGVKSQAKIKEAAAGDAARVLGATFRSRAPVEPVAIAHELNIRVLEAEYEPDTLGGLLVKPGEESKIFLNQRDGVVRRRLTCALELGHYVRISSEADAYGRVDRRGDRSSSEVDLGLVYAEEFAGCLLVPDLEARILIELGMDDLEMALRFLAPRDVVQRRLRDLGLRTLDQLVA